MRQGRIEGEEEEEREEEGKGIIGVVGGRRNT